MTLAEVGRILGLVMPQVDGVFGDMGYICICLFEGVKRRHTHQLITDGFSFLPRQVCGCSLDVNVARALRVM